VTKPPGNVPRSPTPAIDLTRNLDRLLVARYAPPGVLVDDKLQILELRGDIGPYLHPAPGEPPHDITKMARPGLLAPVRAAIAQARRTMTPVREERVEVDEGGSRKRCDVIVLPWACRPGTKEKLFVVLFEDRDDEVRDRNQELTQVNADLVNMVSTLDVAILILDRARRIRRFTPKAGSLLDLVPGDVGRPLDPIRPDRQPCIRVDDLDAQIVEVIETICVKESEVRDRDGRWYRLQIRPYQTPDDKIDGAIVSLVDIDALKHLVGEAQLARGEAERADRAKDQFLAVLAHELRSPLSSMLVQAQLLQERPSDSVLIKRAGESIERGTKVQVQLIDDLLDVSRIMNGKLRMERRVVDLCGVIRAAIDGVSALAARKAIGVSVVLPEPVSRVYGDPTRLQQVVSNLLTNAIKFTPEGGAVSVGLAMVDGHARLTVSDTGIGIEPDFLPHVFTRFAQAGSSTTICHGGLGLGLAIVRYIAEAHGGDVRASSPGKGEGATFLVELPLMPVRLGESAATGISPPSTYADGETADRGLLRDMRILIIDDDAATADAIADMLQRRGAQVALAGSAVEASAVVKQFQPDVLVCDIAMPGEDGYSFIRRLRSLGAANGGAIPALALTALATDSDRRQALSAGFQAHLTKPIDIGHLTRAIGAVVTGAGGSRPS